MGTLTGLTVERIMKTGRIAAFTDSQTKVEIDSNDIIDTPLPPYLTYFDFICKISLFILMSLYIKRELYFFRVFLVRNR